MNPFAVRASFRFEPESAPFLRIRRADDNGPLRPDVTPDTPRKPKRKPSPTGTGRGTGRGEKPATAKLLRPLKPHGKRAAFLKYIGGRAVTMEQVCQQFGMTHANVNGYLINIHKDHGIGYSKEGGTLRLALPKNCTWSNVWGK